MMNTIDAKEWQCLEPKKGGKLVYPIKDFQSQHVKIAVRSLNPVTLNGITLDGKTIFLAWGQTLAFTSKMVGFAALEVVSDGPLSVSYSQKGKFWEQPDPTKMVVPIEDAADKPIQDLIALHMKRAFAKMEADQLLADDVSAEELYEDFVNGDLEFEDEEPDPFGLGYEERMEEYIANKHQAEMEAEEPLPDEQADPQTGVQDGPNGPPSKP